jgi:hypothetical protein
MKQLPVFDSLWADESWAFENEFALSQTSADWIHEAEGNKTILSSLTRLSANLSN